MLIVTIFTERFAYRADVLVQVIFFDYGIGPHALDNFGFFDDMSMSFDQDQQRLKGLHRQRNPFALAQQKLFPRVEAEMTEFIEMRGNIDQSQL